jgi:hypothetical protein
LPLKFDRLSKNFMQRVLSFEQAPPLSIPLRFFLTAPLFATAAAILLMWVGPDALVSRWSPITLTLTHLLTLGFLAMSMIGALLQILPVVAGADVPKVRVTASVVHVSLALGTIALCAAFSASSPALFKLAILFLLSGFLWLFMACLIAVFGSSAEGVTLKVIRVALVGLAVAVTLGLALAGAFAWPLALPVSLLVKLHASWGLVGWVSLLIIGVAFQVVPMFQVTPVYPRAAVNWLPWSVFGLLSAWSLMMAFASKWPNWCAQLLTVDIAAALAAFGVTTLYLLWKRKRSAMDPTTYFWRIGLSCLLLCIAVWLAGQLRPAIVDAPAYPLLLGVLFIAGFAYSIVNGMLYKIVPFLVWYHLQSRIEKGQGKVPNVKKIVADNVARNQCIAHVIALLLLIVAVGWPQIFARLAGAAFAVSSLWLWVNLVQATRLYVQTAQVSSLQRSARASARES